MGSHSSYSTGASRRTAAIRSAACSAFTTPPRSRAAARSDTGHRRATTCVRSACTARAIRTASANRRTAAPGVFMLRCATVVTGMHLTTLDGLSFEMIQPGAYDMYRVADFSVQMLFLSCPHAYRCRRLVEVSLRTNDFNCAVQISDDDQLAVSVLAKSAWERVKRDGDWITIYELTGAVVEWRKDNYVRLLFDDGGLEMLLGYVAGELVCAIEMLLD